jgi:hypothetical protein
MALNSNQTLSNVAAGDLFNPSPELGKQFEDEAIDQATLNHQISQLMTASSLNWNAKDNFTVKVQLSQTEAESKRLVLAFESRQTTEINWALNTLAIYSCNTSQNFTLEN